MPITKKKRYYISVPQCTVYKTPKTAKSKNTVNQLLLGDFVELLADNNDEWQKITCRGTTGWIKKEWLTDERLLEVNFVDIGQGDGCHIVTPENKIILIDAGEGLGFDGKGSDHMLRFLSWRYNLRQDEMIDNPEAGTKLTIDYAIITHPDLDHFYGFHSLFTHERLAFDTVYHNGIVERPIKDGSSSTWLHDFGRKIPAMPYKRTYHLWDTVTTHEEVVKLIEQHVDSNKFYLKTLRAAYKNSPNVKFKFLRRRDGFLNDFDALHSLEMEVLSPLTEHMRHKGEERECLKNLGSQSETKNGHSITLQLRYGNIKMMLGGDLNAKAQDYLAQHYAQTSEKMSLLEKSIRKLKNQIAESTKNERAKFVKLQREQETLNEIVRKLNATFNVDIAKACHHGSSDTLTSFLKAVNPIATIVSSGDNDSYAHPRPEALGAYGKHSRGEKPLIFSTELGRNTHEFSYPFKFYTILKKLEERKNQLTRKKDKEIYQKRMERLRDSNVARYGLITVRTDGDLAIIAQKLEQPTRPEYKWDIHCLKWNKNLNTFETVD